jgi:hypothetical protein
MVSLFLHIVRESRGRVRCCRSVGEIQQAVEQGALAAVLHMEGAEAINRNFEFLDVLHATGLRSLGIWKRRWSAKSRAGNARARLRRAAHRKTLLQELAACAGTNVGKQPYVAFHVYGVGLFDFRSSGHKLLSKVYRSQRSAARWRPQGQSLPSDNG